MDWVWKKSDLWINIWNILKICGSISVYKKDQIIEVITDQIVNLKKSRKPYIAQLAWLSG